MEECRKKVPRIRLGIIGILLLLIIISFSILIPDTVSAASEGDFEYTIADGNATITGYIGAGGNVAIPSTIGGYPVIAIGDYAFVEKVSITSVTIPDSVISIGEGSFRQCTSLTSVTIGDNVTTIGDRSFYLCTSLTNVTIGDNVTTIGEYAFLYCTSLASVTIPDSVTFIGHYVFAACSALTDIDVDADNPNYASEGGVLYNDNITVLIAYPGGLPGPFIFPENVTTIGYGAFAYSPLTPVIIPDTVTSIEPHAFEYSTLTSVTIGNGVATISERSFIYCYSLSSVTLSNNVTTIGNYAFYWCSSLTSIDIPDGVTTIGDYAFSHSTLTSITIPDSVTTIGVDTFQACESLTSVTLGSGLTSIGTEAFLYCTSLTSIEFHGLTMPSSVGSNWISYAPSTIRGHAYYSSDFPAQGSKFNGLTMGDYIPEYTYTVADGKATITGYIGPGGAAKVPATLGGYPVIAIGDHAFDHNVNITSIIIPEGVTTIGIGAFAYSSITSITIPDSVIFIGNNTFSYCSDLTSATIGNGVISLGVSVFSHCSALGSIIIPDSVTSIGGSAFYYCTSLTSITIPDSVTSIGSFAFSSCTSLPSANIGNGVITIGDQAFSYCTSLTTVTIGNNVTTIGNVAFFNCMVLTSVTIPDSTISIGVSAFYNCYALSSVTIGNGLTTISDTAFKRCFELTSITFHGLTAPTTVGTDWIADANASIMGHALRGSNFPAPTGSFNGLLMGSYVASDYLYVIGSGQVTITGYVGAGGDIIIPSTIGGYPVTVINNNAFRYLTSITSVVIPDSIVTIGDGAFEHCTSLRSATIPGSVTLIGPYVFNECRSLESVTIGYGVTTISGAMFAYCTSLVSITIPISVTIIGNAAFYGCSALIAFSIPNNVTTIGDRVFYSCNVLTNVTIGKGVTSIGDRVFYECVSLTAINVDPENPNYTSIDEVLYNKNVTKLIAYPGGLSGSFIIPDGVTEIGDFACAVSALTSVTMPDSLITIGNSAFERSIMTSVTIPDGVITIGNDAFERSALSSITIPDSVSSMGYRAFYYCLSLSSVTIGNNVTTIIDSTFMYCSALSSVTIGSSVTTIGWQAFYHCTALTTLVLPYGLTTIGSQAFAWCSGLTSIIIPNSVTSIGSTAFGECSSLTSITIPESVTTIGNYAFSNSGLTSIILPNSLASISIRMLAYCYDLTSVTIGSGVTTINDKAFYYCSALTSITFLGLTAPTTVGSDWILNTNANVRGHAYYSSDFPASGESFYELLMGDYIPEFTYYVADGNATITGYIGPGGAVKIPATLGGFPVVAIADYAFMDCSILTSITIPSSVTSIGVLVFYECSALTAIDVDPANPNYASVDRVLYNKDMSVLIQYPGGLSGPFVIPNGVTAIGNDAFAYCSLTSVTIPDSVTVIGFGAFLYCQSLGSVRMGNGVTVIHDFALSYCFALTSITLPDSLTTVDWNAFEGNIGLTYVTFGSGVTTIGGQAFAYCDSLVSINFRGLTAPTSVSEYWLMYTPSSVRGHAYYSSNFPLQGYSFYGLTMGAYIPEYTYTVTDGYATITGYIGPGGAAKVPSTLGGCPVVAIGDYAFDFNDNITSITIPFSVTSIGREAFYYCTALTSVTLGDGITSIAEYAFADTALTSITIPGNVTTIGENAFAWSDLTSVTLSNSATSIGNEAFYYCLDLISVDLGDSVTSIGESAFSGCNALASIDIPASVTIIGDYAFMECSALTAINVDLANPNYASEGGVLFNRDMTLLIQYPAGIHGSFAIPGSVTTVGKYAFYGCAGLTSVTIPDTVTSIEAGAFFFCAGPTSIDIPDSITTIEDATFGVCLNLTSVTIPNSVTSIGNSAFFRCTALTSITIPNSVASIGMYAFYSCTSLTSIVIPNGVTTIENWTFDGCSALTSVTIPNSVTSIGSWAFRSCSALTSITIPDSVITIGYEAFRQCTLLTSVNIGKGVTTIGDYAFSFCTSLNQITIPGNVTTIGVMAFGRCTSLSSITFLGLAQPTSVGSYWIVYTDPAIRGHARYASDFPPSGGYFYGLIMGDYIFEGFSYTVTDGKATITGYLGAGGDVTIPSSLEGCPVIAIGDNAFQHNTDIISMTIPDSVTSIGGFAFAACPSLTAIKVDPSNANYASEGGVLYSKDMTVLIAFPGGLSEPFVVPDSVTSIGEGAFAFSALTSVTLGGNVGTIGAYAFSNCTSLISITFHGLYAPTNVGAYWIDDTNSSIVGHALRGSNFPAPGGSFNGLLMGSYIATDYLYAVGSETVTITGYVGPGGDISIPSTIGGRPVTVINNQAFQQITSITSVIIPEGVRTIGDYAFRYCTSLTSVEIPGSVTLIGIYLFYQCTNLTSINIPNSVTTIGASAFAHCSALTSINIPESVTYIGDYTFYDCSALTSINIPNSVTTIGNSAFYYSGLTSIFIPGSVTLGNYVFGFSNLTSVDLGSGISSINMYTFSHCSALTSINIPDTVTRIGRFAFYYCTSLTSIDIPDSVTIIDPYAFSYSGLTSITIGNGVTTIGDHAFNHCTSLVSVSLGNSVSAINPYVFYYCTSLTTINIPDSVTIINTNAFGSCRVMESITISAGVTSISDNAFTGCSSLVSFDVDDDNPNYASDNGLLCSKDLTILIKYPEGLTGPFVIPESITTIGPYACASSHITSLTIPDTVTSIGVYAFDSCSGLTSVIIGSGITAISDRTFQSCQALSSVTIPNSVTSIGRYAFYYATSLKNITIPNCVTVIGDDAFAFSALTSITIPDSVTTIGVEAFWMCASLTTVNMGSGVTTIGDQAFLYCTSLISIVIPDGVTYIHSYTFESCTSLTTVTIGSGIISIGSYTFQDCTSLTSIYFRGAIKPTCGAYWILNAPSTIRGHATYSSNFPAPNSTFYGLIMGDYIPEFTYSIADGNATITGYIGPGGAAKIPSTLGGFPVIAIGANSFQYNANITSITIPDSVTSIGNFAFFRCSALTSVTIGSGVTTIGRYAFADLPALTSVTIGIGVTSIGTEAFRSCTALTSVTIPDSVTTIDFYAFSGCSALTSVTIGSGVTLIDAGVFSGCSALTAINVDLNNSYYASVDKVLYSKDLTVLIQYPLGLSGPFIIPNGVTTIGKDAFRECSGLTSIIIPDSVTSVGFNAFSECSSLASVTMGSGVTVIHDFAFAHTNITSITLSDSVTTIDWNVFEGCYHLTSVTFGSGVTTIGGYTFAYCDSLVSINFRGLTAPTSVSEYWLIYTPSGMFGHAFIESNFPTKWGSFYGLTMGDYLPEYAYTVTDGNATIIAYLGPNGDVTIPSTLGGYPVIAINASSFQNNVGITSIIIPDSVTTIGDNAFQGCVALTSVTIGQGVTSIGLNAFANCTSLISMNFHGLTAPTVGSDWINGTNASIVGHALRSSSFPAPGSSFNELLMGSYIANDYVYVIGSGQVTITGYVGAGGDIIIPSTIGGYPVTVINNNAFRYLTHITSVVIPDGIVTIGDFAFEACTSLTSVTIPGSVTLMGIYLFSQCRSLESVTIGYGVTTIGHSDFAYCTSLTSVTMPGSVTLIGESAFHGCSAITAFTIPDGVTTIERGAFRDCSALTAFIIPNSVTTIGDAVFQSCDVLTTVNIGRGVTSMGTRVFSDCGNLTIIIVDSENPNYTSMDWVLYNKNVTKLIAYPGGLSGSFIIPFGVTEIGDYAFELSVLTSVTIPDSVITIGNSTFRQSALTAVIIPNSVRSLGSLSFYECSSLSSATIGDNVTSIESQSFAYCTALSSVIIGSKVTAIKYRAFYECEALTAITLPYGLTTIINGAFSYSGLTSITIPESVTTIGDYAFSYSDLGSITIPNSLVTISDGLFYRCYDLTSVTIGSGVTTIDGYAFFFCTSLTSITFHGLTAPTSVGSSWISYTNTNIRGHAYYASNFQAPGDSFYGLIMGEYIYEGYTYTVTDGNATITGYLGAGGDVTIPNTLGGCPVIAIGDHAFQNNENITSLSVTSSVQTIGMGAFSNCVNMTKITIGSGVISIGDHAFDGASVLTSITVDVNNPVYTSRGYFYVNPFGWTLLNVGCLYDKSLTTLIRCPEGLSYLPIPGYTASITTILDGACRGCKHLTSLYVPSTVTSIGDQAFYGCTGLITVEMLYNIASIGEQAFAGCSNLTTVHLGDSILSIGEGAFMDCEVLASIDIPVGITSIQANLFHGCSSLTAITIPSGVTIIGDSAFGDCTSLTSITFLGLIAPTTGDGWIANTNGALLGHAYEISEFPHTGSSFNGLTMGSYLPCEYAYTFEFGQVTITGYSGSGGEVEVPSSIGGCPVIGLYHAFEGCTTITSVTIPYGVVTIGENTFNNCTELTQVAIPDSVVTIGASAFSGCVGLTSVTIPDSVVDIGDYAFYHCQWLTWVSIGTGLESIGDSAFAHCYCLASILFQGTTAPTSVGTDWIYLAGIIAPFDLRGYAYYGSDFPAPGDLWNGLMMGTYLPTDYTFTISPDFGENSVTITGYIGSDTVITIPSTIAGFPVTVLHSLGESDDITSVTVPDSVTVFDSYAMYHCTALTTVNIGSGLVSLGFEPFMMCRALTAVNMSPSNPNLASFNGVVYSKDMSELIYCPYGISGEFDIPNGVQIIRDRAFYTCNLLTSITIPDTVTFIGNSSFEACMGLASVIIPDSVTYLGSTVFQNCRSLTSVVIGDNVPAILARTFWYCEMLGSVTIGNNVTYIGDCAFQDNFYLTSLNIPDSVTEIGNNAFDWCFRLYDVTIGSGITSIGNYAFRDCYHLFSITFLGLNPPVVGAGWVEYAGRDYAWGTGAKGHAYLGSNFPAPGGSLNGLIMGSYIPIDFTFILAYGQVGITGYTGSGGAITIPDQIMGYPVTAIGNSAFYGCSTLTSVIIPDSVTTIGDQAFGYCQSLTSVTIGSEVTSFGMNAFAYCSALSSVTIRDGVTEIGNSAFYGCSALTSVIIPDSVITIEGQAFGECHALSSVIIGNGVTSISIGAFVECTSLTSVTIPSSVTSISLFVFGGCSALTAIDVHSDNPKYASDGGVLYSKDMTVLIQYPAGLSGLFVIPDGVTRIGDYGFYGCSALTSVIIPDSVTTIGAYAFLSCGSITSVTIPYSVTTIGTWGFGKCVNLTSINFEGFVAPATVGSNWISGSNPSILGHAYADSNFPAPGELFYGLTMGSYYLGDYTYTFDGSQVTITGYTGSGGEITIPDQIGGYPVTIIADRSFQYNANITSLTIPCSVDVIGEYAFDHCSALQSVIIIGSGSTVIGDCSFQGSGVKTVVIGSGVRSIGEHAFGNCQMTSFTIDEGLETICLRAFDYSSISEGLFLPSTVTSISSTDDDFRTMGAFFYCMLPSIDVDGGNPVFSSLDGVLYDKAFSKLLVYPSGRPDTSFTVPGTVSVIDNYSFFDCKYLVSLTVPGSVDAINMGAFTESDALSSIIIENGLTIIGVKAFFSCYALNSVTFPESLTHIGDSAFWDCRSLSSIDLPEGLLVIGSSAFYHCPTTTLDIPDSVILVGAGAFSSCTNLATVSVGSAVVSMGGAFSGCSALTAIDVDTANSYYASIGGVLYNKTITALIKYPAARPNTSYAMPNTVTLIVTDALMGCSNLLSLTLSDGLESIEGGRTIGCPNIASLTIPGGVTHIGARAFSGCTSLQNVNFLGMTPPVGDLIDGVYYLILGTPSGALGHAYYASSFPAPGERFGGLLMGSYLADVIFSQTGVDTSNANIVLMVDGTTYLPSQLPITFIWYSGSTHSFEWSQTVEIDSGTRFGWRSSSGLSDDASGSITVPDVGGTVSAVYVTQHKVSFIALGLDSDAGVNTVLTVGSTTYVWNGLPYDIWVDDGTAFFWSDTVPATDGRVFTLVQHSSLSSPITYSSTETAEYFKSMTISGHVYLSGTTIGSSGWRMQLWKGGSQVGTDVVTDSSGAYTFTVTLPGTYEVREVLKDGWTETSPILTYSAGDGSTPAVLGYDGITVTSGIDVDGMDLENFEWITVSGYKYEYLGEFNDDFEDGDYAGWVRNDPGDVSWSAEGNSLVRTSSNGVFSNSRIRYDVPFDDYTFEADARLIGGAGYALMFRAANDLSSFYSFQYDPGAGSKLVLTKFTSFPAGSDLAPSVAYPMDDGWHHLKVTVIGNHIQCYIDSIKVFDVVDASSPLSSGDIGFRTWDYATDAEFDNVRVMNIENPLSGWNVHLHSSGGSQSTTTDTNGRFEFTVTEPGAYWISETLQPMWTAIYPVYSVGDGSIDVEVHVHDVSVVRSGVDLGGWDIWNFEWLTVTGVKFFDANGNGLRESEEPLLQNWAISIERDGALYVGPILTDAGGRYELIVKDPGCYIVAEQGKYLWVQTYPFDGTYSFHARSGHDEVGLDFGNWLGGQVMVTTSDISMFDIDENATNGRQFKLLFTPDVPDAPSLFALTASNPGQFCLNAFFLGSVSEGDTFTLSVPFPFVTQGTEPIHVYSGLNTDPLGWLVPGADISSLFGFSATAISWSYDGQSGFSDRAVITLTALDDYSGFLYINLHLDYGLKKNIGELSPGGSNDAVGTVLTIEEGWQYTFSVTGPEGFSDEDEVMNVNSFKRSPGFGGLVLDEDGDPVVGAVIEIWLKNVLIGTAVTDEDGWYMLDYKHLGKPATFTLKLYIDEEPITEITVTVKPASFSMVIFDLSTPSEPPPPPEEPPEEPPTKPPKPPKEK